MGYINCGEIVYASLKSGAKSEESLYISDLVCLQGASLPCLLPNFGYAYFHATNI